MCLAIYKPAKVTIPLDHLENGFISNPHGAGFSIARNGEIETYKGYFTYEAFLAAWVEANKDGTNPAALIHFRWATHGEQNTFNCHPWEVCGGKYSAVHNGIINIQSTKEKSDTGHFIDLVLSPAIEAFRDTSHPALKYMVEQSLGGGNKVAVMDTRGKATIYNEKSGIWDKGVWYSNDGYDMSWGGYSVADCCNDKWETNADKHWKKYWANREKKDKAVGLNIPGLKFTPTKGTGHLTRKEKQILKKAAQDQAAIKRQMAEDEATSSAFPDFNPSPRGFETVEDELCELCGIDIPCGDTAVNDSAYGTVCVDCYLDINRVI